MGSDAEHSHGPLVVMLSFIEAKRGFEQLLTEELCRLVRSSRREAGCLLFDLYRIASQHSRFALYEVWEIRAAMEAHARNFHTTKFRMTAEEFLAQPIEVLELEEVI
jgi:quinol monooxygenase YgiN